MLPQHFHISADLQIVTTKAAHVLYDNDRYSVSFDFSNHLLKARSVELRTRDTIIRKVDAVGKTVLFGVVLQYALLRRDLSRYVFAKECAIRIDKQQKERYNNVVIDNDVII